MAVSIWKLDYYLEGRKNFALNQFQKIHFFLFFWGCGNCPTLKFEKDSIPKISDEFMCFFFPQEIPLEFPDEKTKAQQINTGNKISTQLW